MSSDLTTTAHAAASALRAHTQHTSRITPSLAIVLGSGLGGLANDVHDAIRVPYRDVPGFPPVQVHGHAGEVILGTLNGVSVIVFAGRSHVYEGHSAALTSFSVRVAHAYGVHTLFVSNAAGAINPRFTPGDLMVIEDHLNLMGTSPLIGLVNEGDARFPDMSMPYDPALRVILHATAERHGMTLHSGVYAALLGPAYETRAEVRMLRTLGADAVGMSTVPEVITARALGMRVVGVSCITNMACGVTDARLDHADVLLTTARVAEKFQVLVREFVVAL